MKKPNTPREPKTRAPKYVPRKKLVCPVGDCRIPKEEWMEFCFAHWYKLTREHRQRIVHLRDDVLKALTNPVTLKICRADLRKAVNTAKKYLIKACAPLN